MLELNYPIVRNFHLSLDLAPTPNNDGDGDKGEITAKRGKSHILYKGRYKGPLYGEWSFCSIEWEKDFRSHFMISNECCQWCKRRMKQI